MQFGLGPFAWSVTGGGLPAGLTLDPATGAVTGTPTASGTFHFTLIVTDSGQESRTQAETVTIAAAPTAMGGGTLNADVGVAVGDQLSTHGGTGPYVWSVASGTMPPGVVLSATGSISGVPADPGYLHRGRHGDRLLGPGRQRAPDRGGHTDLPQLEADGQHP